jgi:hypothetical protein
MMCLLARPRTPLFRRNGASGKTPQTFVSTFTPLRLISVKAPPWARVFKLELDFMAFPSCFSADRDGVVACERESSRVVRVAPSGHGALTPHASNLPRAKAVAYGKSASPEGAQSMVSVRSANGQRIVGCDRAVGERSSRPRDGATANPGLLTLLVCCECAK